MIEQMLFRRPVNHTVAKIEECLVKICAGKLLPTLLLGYLEEVYVRQACTTGKCNLRITFGCYDVMEYTTYTFLFDKIDSALAELHLFGYISIEVPDTDDLYDRTVTIHPKVIQDAINREFDESRPRAKTKGSTITPKKRFQALAEARFSCVYCGRKAPDVVLHVDHVLPESSGGGTFDNLVAACEDCNLGKGKRNDLVKECRAHQYSTILKTTPSSYSGSTS